MWIYEKKLEYPIKITCPDARMAKLIIEQFGGSDAELAASLRYLSQKYTMVTPWAKGLLNDIGIKSKFSIKFKIVQKTYVFWTISTS